MSGAFVTLPEAITGTPEVSVPDSGVSLAGVTVIFSSTSRYVSFISALESVTTDSDGLVRIEVTRNEDTPSWSSGAEITAECVVEDVTISDTTSPLSLKAS